MPDSSFLATNIIEERTLHKVLRVNELFFVGSFVHNQWRRSGVGNIAVCCVDISDHAVAIPTVIALFILW
jgi:hypothetical protein